MSLEAQDVIRLLELAPHPEGGHYRQTFRDPAPAGPRGASTAIYYLLRDGERSHWHRIDAAEVWHWYAGAPLRLEIAADGRREAHVLGPHLEEGQRPQIVVPARAWQSAVSLGAWTLTGCTVAPAFDFATFELAPKDFSPPLTP